MRVNTEEIKKFINEVCPYDVQFYLGLIHQGFPPNEAIVLVSRGREGLEYLKGQGFKIEEEEVEIKGIGDVIYED